MGSEDVLDLLTGDTDSFCDCRAVFERRRVTMGDLTEGALTAIKGSLALGLVGARDGTAFCKSHCELELRR